MGLFDIFKDDLGNLKEELATLNRRKKQITESWNRAIEKASTKISKDRAKKEKATELHNLQITIDSVKRRITNCKR